MTLEEAIEHARQMSVQICNTSCGREHAQLADWLEELKRSRAFLVHVHEVLEKDFRDYGADYLMNNKLADEVRDFVNGTNRNY